MAGFLQSLTEQYREQVSRHKNLPFLKATMASCAVVATADGKLSYTERVRVDQILATLEQLQVFDPHEGVDLFLEFAEHILMAPKDGHERALEALDWVKDEPETAKLIIRICLAVAESNGDNNARMAGLRDIVAANRKAGEQRTDRMRFLAAKASIELADPIRRRFEVLQLTQPLAKSVKLKKSLMEDALAAYAEAAAGGRRGRRHGRDVRVARLAPAPGAGDAGTLLSELAALSGRAALQWSEAARVARQGRQRIHRVCDRRG